MLIARLVHAGECQENDAAGGVAATRSGSLWLVQMRMSSHRTKLPFERASRDRNCDRPPSRPPGPSLRPPGRGREDLRPGAPGCAAPFAICAERCGEVWVVRLSGELDLATAPLLHEALDRAEQVQGPVLIDLEGLRFLDGAGLRALLAAHGRLGERLTLTSARGLVAKLFRVTGLDATLPFAPHPERQRPD